MTQASRCRQPAVFSLGGAFALFVEVERLDDVLVDERRRAKRERNPDWNLEPRTTPPHSAHSDYTGSSTRHWYERSVLRAKFGEGTRKLVEARSMAQAS